MIRANQLAVEKIEKVFGEAHPKQKAGHPRKAWVFITSPCAGCRMMLTDEVKIRRAFPNVRYWCFFKNPAKSGYYLYYELKSSLTFQVIRNALCDENCTKEHYVFHYAIGNKKGWESLLESLRVVFGTKAQKSFFTFGDPNVKQGGGSWENRNFVRLLEGRQPVGFVSAAREGHIVTTQEEEEIQDLVAEVTEEEEPTPQQPQEEEKKKRRRGKYLK
jgi:hypothetical protein